MESTSLKDIDLGDNPAILIFRTEDGVGFTAGNLSTLEVLGLLELAKHMILSSEPKPEHE